ncbi:MAG: divergent PAP2 family protein [Anaerolineales bacterium]|nr:divergent PAP2 family protein [Anaerolineales bacterium]
MGDFLGNRVLQATLFPWATAQILKVIIELIWHRKLNLRLLTSAGGMPSSHSAMVCGLATAIAIHDGAGSSAFALSIVLAMVVMYDAAGIRRWASIQARILNQIIDELFQGHPISEVRLREILGHTPIQVAAGAALGIVMAWWWLARS